MKPSRQPGEDDGQQLDLSSLDREFAAVALPERRPTIPDGRYRAQIVHVELATTRASGRPILKWKLRILGPTHDGRLLWKTSMLATSANLRWLKHDLHVCGLDLVCLSELPRYLADLLDVELDVTKQTRGDWENIYFNGRLDICNNPTVPF